MEFELKRELFDDPEKALTVCRNLFDYLSLQRVSVSEAMYYYQKLHYWTYVPELLVQGLTGLFLLGGSYGIVSPWLPISGGIVDVLLLTYSPIRHFYAFESKAKEMTESLPIIDAAIRNLNLYFLVETEVSDNFIDVLEKAVEVTLQIENDYKH